MKREEAEEIAQGYTAQCESGMRDWGWIDSADSPCRSFLFFHPDYCSGSFAGLSSLGMIDVVNEGDPLDHEVEFRLGVDRENETKIQIDH